MIHYELMLPLEAIVFLTNHVLGYTFDSFFENLSTNNPDFNDKLKEYHQTLNHLEQKLTGSIEADDLQLKKLFYPLNSAEQLSTLNSKDQIATLISCNNIANLLVSPNRFFGIADCDRFFAAVRGNAGMLPTEIACTVAGISPVPSSPFPDADIFRILNDCSWNKDAKLALMDLVLNIDSYTDQLEQAITPVIKCLQTCIPELSSFFSVFSEEYSAQTDTIEIVKKLCQFPEKDKVRRCDIYPVLTDCTQCCIIINDDNPKNLEVDAFIGMIYHELRHNYAMKSNTDMELSRILNVLGNQKRFQLLKRLTEGPACGRELADYLGLTPGTVSQHISMLMGAGLVDASSDGAKFLYSVNTEQIQHLIRMIGDTFLS